MKVIYISHPLTAPSEVERLKNAESAERWAAWIAWTFKVATITEWAGLARFWTEEQGRALGLELDKEHVRRSDEVWLLNPNGEGIVSSGMLVEALEGINHGKAVYNLTSIEFGDRVLIQTMVKSGRLEPRWVP